MTYKRHFRLFRVHYSCTYFSYFGILSTQTVSGLIENWLYMQYIEFTDNIICRCDLDNRTCLTDCILIIAITVVLIVGELNGSCLSEHVGRTNNIKSKALLDVVNRHSCLYACVTVFDLVWALGYIWRDFP
jgi:hypothetical protein